MSFPSFTNGSVLLYLVSPLRELVEIRKQHPNGSEGSETELAYSTSLATLAGFSGIKTHLKVSVQALKGHRENATGQTGSEVK